MGAFIEQVQKNNTLQKNIYFEKQQEKREAAKRRAENEKRRTAERQEKQKNIEALQELENVINILFDKLTGGHVARRKFTATQCNYILQRIDDRNGIIKDIARGNSARAQLLDKNYNNILQRTYKKYLQNENAIEQIAQLKQPEEKQQPQEQPPDTKQQKAYKMGLMFRYFASGAAGVLKIAAGVLTFCTACIIGIFWGLFDIAKK